MPTLKPYYQLMVNEITAYAYLGGPYRCGRRYVEFWEVSDIKVIDPRKRGNGVGTELLKQICADADTDGVLLRLIVAPEKPGYLMRLRKWYRRHGFVATGKSRMERQPRER